MIITRRLAEMRSGLKQKIVGARSIQDAEEAAKSESSVFMRTDGDSVDTHMLNGVVVTTWLSHIAEVENVGFIYFQIFHQQILCPYRGQKHGWR